jgi:biotin transport system substrate-specific component
MQKEFSSPMGFSAVRAGVSWWLRPVGIVLGSSALLALCAHIALPLSFTPIPLSLQPFGVLLLGLLLSPRAAVAAVGSYLVEGACGLPVFAPTPLGSGGLVHLFGPTGGYLMAYPLAAALISFLWRQTGRGFSTALVSAALGDLLILALGTIWLMAGTHIPTASAVSAALLAFLPGDTLKIVAAAGIAAAWRRAGAPSDR